MRSGWSSTKRNSRNKCKRKKTTRNEKNLVTGAALLVQTLRSNFVAVERKRPATFFFF